jgi:large subunit ribosomal protein L24
MKIRKDDNVIVVSGKDKGKTGKVSFAFPRENSIIISGVNMKKVHQKARKSDQKGKVVEKEAPINASNVMLVGSNGKGVRLNKVRGGKK